MGHRITLTAPAWHLSGVNTMTATLAHALASQGHEPEILLTQTSDAQAREYMIDGALEFHTLPVAPDAGFPARWRSLRAWLAGRAPCVYLPGYDFENSTVCPALPPQVGIIGVLHSDEPHYFEMTARVGATWNRIVGVSHFLADEVSRRHPAWADRVRHIPYGVAIPAAPPPPRSSAGPLRVVLAGRVSRYQKRVQDLPRLLDALERAGTPIHLTVVGDGPDLGTTREACARHTAAGRVQFVGSLANKATLQLFEEQHVILMLSEFEGLPLVLLEAMGRGCVPVTSAIRSGIPELVHDGQTGFRFPVGDIDACAQILHRLATEERDRLATLSNAAWNHIARGPYTTGAMVQRYLEAIDETLHEAADGRSPGRTGRMAPPPQLSTAMRCRAAVSRTLRRLLGRHRA